MNLRLYLILLEIAEITFPDVRFYESNITLQITV